MQENTYNFEYNPKNLDMFNLDIFGGAFEMDLIMIALMIAIAGIAFYIVGPYLKGYFMVTAEEKKKEENKNKIKELIMMKEVQNELEREIEESLLNSGLKASAI